MRQGAKYFTKYATQRQQELQDRLQFNVHAAEGQSHERQYPYLCTLIKSATT